MSAGVPQPVPNPSRVGDSAATMPSIRRHLDPTAFVDVIGYEQKTLGDGRHDRWQYVTPVVFDDSLGLTSLEFTAEIGEGQDALYAVTYTHADPTKKTEPVPHELHALMGQHFYFDIWRADNKLGIMTSFNQPFICADHQFLRSSSRAILLPLAHEIGHTWQKGWVDALCAESITPKLGTKVLQDWYRGSPWLEDVAADFLEVAKRNPKVPKVLHENFCDPHFPIPLGAAFHVTPFIGNSLRQVSEEAYLVVKAASEVYAWQKAVTLAKTGKFHPGMTNQESVDFISDCLESYDRLDNTKIYTRMFGDALRTPARS